MISSDNIAWLLADNVALMVSTDKNKGLDLAMNTFKPMVHMFSCIEEIHELERALSWKLAKVVFIDDRCAEQLDDDQIERFINKFVEL